MIVKICGITNIRDARVAVESGADMLGFIFSPSPRQVNAERVKKIISDLPPEIVTVGVFVNSDRDFVLSAINDCKLEKLQFHGNESPEYCQEFRQGVIKAFRVKDKRVLSYLPKYRVEAYLLDTYFPGQAGGTGRTFNWSIAK
ncbi:MAG: phosphoribosylanthranilate isomerase, partial [Dehalococcoidia bacterium]|nr:phosphoribosylanthranilate isomerase [Dehalococcoidia bacterium]